MGSSSSILGILPLLVSGYLFNLICYPLRFFCGNADGQRLFFMSAGSGLLLGTISFVCSNFLSTELSPSSSVVSFGKLLDSSIPVPYAGSLLLALLLGPLFAVGVNGICFCYKRSVSRVAKTPTAKWVYKNMIDRFGSPLAQLFRRAADEQKLVLLSLKSRKVYCGRVLEVPFNLDVDDQYIEFLPKFSGYRDKDTLELGKARTDYPSITLWEANRYLDERRAVLAEVEESKASNKFVGHQREVLEQAYSKLLEEISDLTTTIEKIDAPGSFDIYDWIKVIPVKEIESASFFDSDAFSSWFSNDGTMQADSTAVDV